MAVLRETIYDLDKTAFGVIDMMGMKTMGFINIDDVTNQLWRVHDVINNNPDYDFNLGTSEFLEELAMYNKRIENVRSWF